MASSSTKSLYTSCCSTILLLLLLLLLSDVASHAQAGRRLSRRRQKAYCKGSCPVQAGGQTRDHETGGATFAGRLTAVGIARRKVLLVEDSQASRPTAPGHSPGVGHFFQGEAAAAAQQKDADSRTLSVDTQDARPTVPGHSPGVGHSLLLHDREKYGAADVKDFRPTMPGNSPGIGHSDESKGVVDVKFSAEERVDRSTSLNTEDLRPTEPGSSPGVGHGSFEISKGN